MRVPVFALLVPALAFAQFEPSAKEDETNDLPGPGAARRKADAGTGATATAAATVSAPDAGHATKSTEVTHKEKVQLDAQRVTRGIDVKEDMAAAPSKPALDVSKMSFSRDNIMKVVAYHQDEVQSCYEQTLAGLDKPIEGVLMTSFAIDAEGAVKKPKIEKQGTTVKNVQLNACVLQILGHMRFPKPANGKSQAIRYPFNLKAVH